MLSKEEGGIKTVKKVLHILNRLLPRIKMVRIKMRAVAMTLNAICRSIVLLNLRSESFIVSTFGWFKNFVFETNIFLSI